MNFIKTVGHSAALATVIIFAPAAFALDGNDFSEKFLAMVEAGNPGLDAQVENVHVSGDVITITGLSFIPPHEKPLNINGGFVFSGVSENGKGGYLAKSAHSDGLTASQKNYKISIGNIDIDDLHIQAEPMSDALESMMAYSNVSADNLLVEANGAPVFTVAHIDFSNQPNADLTMFNTDYTVSGIQADLSKIPEPEAQAVLAMLEFKTLNAHAEGQIVWNRNTGDLNFLKAATIIDNVGTLNFTAGIAGYTLELLERQYATQRRVSKLLEQPKDKVDIAALTAATDESLNLFVDNLLLKDLSVRFDDDGITSKLLDFAASMQGTTGDVLAAGLSAALPAMAAQAGAPKELQSALVEAAATYFTDPKSLIITASPRQAVPIKALSDAAEDPRRIFGLLNLSILANQ